MCGNHNPGDAAVCLRCGHPAGASPADGSSAGAGRSPDPDRRFRRLADLLTVLLPVSPVLDLPEVPDHPLVDYRDDLARVQLTIKGTLLILTTMLFLIWLYQARKKAGRLAWPQRRAVGWVIGGWLVPPVFLWFPFQIVTDIWRAGFPPAFPRRRFPWSLPAWWWTFWLLAWLLTPGSFPGPVVGQAHLAGRIQDLAGSAFALAAAVLLVVIVRRVSAGPVGRLPESPAPLPPAPATLT